MIYFNEFDPFPAAWLRNLYPAATVDDRSITDVQSTDLAGYDRAHFFGGIGGWEYALKLAGWPTDRPVWTGSCPCQPFSAAGKRGGGSDERHLWPAWYGLIRECRPATIFGEQVPGAIAHGWLDAVFTDLEAEGYACGAVVLGACSVGAPHRRQRLYWVADAEHAKRGAVGVNRENGRDGPNDGRAEAYGQPRTRGEVHGVADASDVRLQGRGGAVRDVVNANGQTAVCGGANGALANSDGRNASAEREQCGGQQRQQPGDSGVVGDFGGWGELIVTRCPDVDGRWHVDGYDVCVSDDGLAALRRDHDEWTSDDRLANTQDANGRGAIGAADAGRRFAQIGGSSPFGAWDDIEWIDCRDGKARPTKPGIHPLAYGVPGRVGKLRAYGNAIVPQTAAAFVRAYLEAVQA